MRVQVNGTYRGKPVSGEFDQIRPWTGSPGQVGFVTVVNGGHFPGFPATVRISCEESQCRAVGGTTSEAAPGSSATATAVDRSVANWEQEFTRTETDEEAMARIRETFAMLDTVTDACARGTVRGLVVSGPPGVGKSYGVEAQLAAANLFHKIEGGRPKYEIVGSGISHINLYKKLYARSGAGQVLVFDDCDEVLFDEDMLNMLKQALNSSDRRRISWNKESRVLAQEGIDREFDFEGSVIFLSNIDFERTIARGSRLSDHLKAIMSRCHYLDMAMGNQRDLLLRIRQVVNDGMLTNYEFGPAQVEMILGYVEANAEFLRDLSLRTVKKIADFVKSDPNRWEELVESTCLQREARFKRMYHRREQARRQGLELIGSDLPA